MNSIHGWIFMIGTAVVLAAQTAQAQDQDIETLLREASAASRSAMDEFSCEGSYVHTDPEGVVREILFDLAYRKPKVFMSLREGKSSRKRVDDRANIYFDGESLFVTLFSERIHPAGCETAVFEKAEQFSYTALGFWPFPWGLHDDIDIALVLDGELGNTLETEFDVEGTIHGRYDLTPRVSAKFRAPESVGYNIAFAEARNNNGGADPYEQIEVDWVKLGSHWVIKSLRQTRLREDTLVWAREVVLENISLDRVDPNLFSMRALGICANSRILDQRPNAPKSVYHFDGFIGASGESGEALLSRLEKQQPPRPAEAADGERD